MRHLLLGILLLVSGYYLFSGEEDVFDTPPTETLGQAEKPTAYVEGAQFVFYKDNGQANFDLSSEKATYFKDSARVIISQPRLEMIQESGDHVTLRANSGHYDTERETLSFEGEVELRQSRNQETAMILSTEQLQVDQQAQTLSTDHNVTLQQGPHALRALGMRANLTSKKIELLSQVRGQYVFDKNDG